MITLLYPLILICMVFFPESLHPHGFDKNTLVKTGNRWQLITQVCHTQLNEKLSIPSYDTQKEMSVVAQVKSAGRSETNCYLRMTLDDTDTIICTPSQEFYSFASRKFIPAYMLNEGDILLNKSGTGCRLTHRALIKKPLTVYSLEIDTTHTYFVAKQAILTHNMLIPWVLSAGLGISFGSGAAGGSLLGGFFGPVTFAGGLVCGGIVGIAIKKLVGNDQLPAYTLSFDIDLIDNCMHRNGKGNDETTQQGSSGGLSNEEAKTKATEWGYKETKEGRFNSHGKPKFIKGNSIITPDRDGHNGGVWKEFDKKNRRIGTLDHNGNKIKG